ncbi:MAG: glycosyltransferase family 2 protein [Planctomycetota bacterium]
MIKHGSPSNVIPLARSGKICVVTPCYHEQDGIAAFHRELKNVLETGCRFYEHEIVFVDDGSSDQTLDRLKEIAASDPFVSVYSLSRNQGHQTALSAGLDRAVGDAVIMMDSDLQHPPELIPEMIQRWQSGNEIVLAVRRQTEDASWFKRVTSSGFYWVFNALSDVKLTPGAADFCLLSNSVHQQLISMPEKQRFLRGMIAWLGFQPTKIEYTAPPRYAGASSYGLARMTKLAINATVSFSNRPIRLAAKGGIVCFVGGLLYLTYIFSRSVLLGDLVPGWASILGAVILMGGIQLLSIGLIGEYLAHVFEEVKGRPAFVFKYSHAARNASSSTDSGGSSQSDGSIDLPETAMTRKAS